ncbi:hypothetical protein LSAT2_002124 [Lamellibrachia satsuma]|nr:hypothetical protein LSAT2_002124 [Lamellibrachia satsuma]
MGRTEKPPVGSGSGWFAWGERETTSWIGIEVVCLGSMGKPPFGSGLLCFAREEWGNHHGRRNCGHLHRRKMKPGLL